MTRIRVFQLAALTIVIAFGLFGQLAFAQSPHHFSVHVVPAQSLKAGAPAGTPLLFQLSYGMGVLPPLDGSGADQWPCFGGGADCSTISPGGVVIGTPAYTQSLANCDGNTSSSPNCAQIFWFYEDDTGDNTDHLIVSIVAKQGANYVLDTGNFDFGPNPFPAGSIIIISDDTAFGTLGQTGKNNGFCNGSKKTCSDPVAGVVNITVTTQIGKQKISAKFNVNLQ